MNGGVTVGVKSALGRVGLCYVIFFVSIFGNYFFSFNLHLCASARIGELPSHDSRIQCLFSIL